jgi:predicted  nucleic acid-binding Zn-ribbon protein
MAELRSAEATLAERDASLAAAAGLREQLSELGRERSQLEHHKQRVAELEAGKADVESQLSGLAALVASLESRLRDATAQSAAASAAAELAAATAAKAQAAVAEQVSCVRCDALQGVSSRAAGTDSLLMPMMRQLEHGI